MSLNFIGIAFLFCGWYICGYIFIIIGIGVMSAVIAVFNWCLFFLDVLQFNSFCISSENTIKFINVRGISFWYVFELQGYNRNVL